MDRLVKAIAAFDAYNKNDSTNVEYNGQLISKELLYAQRMSERLQQYAPNSPEHLQLAARCQHIGRWEIGRGSYPTGRKGYLQWRNAVNLHHASLAEIILRQCNYDQELIDKVKFLLLKKQLQQNTESQLLEDIICLVFIEYYLEEFAAKHDDEKVIDIVRKTMLKMSPTSIAAVSQINLPEKLNRLLTLASKPPKTSGLFRFEQEFMDDNIRCIPMAVRFKLDLCGIKLKLSEWNKFALNERSKLNEIKAGKSNEITAYRNYVQQLVLVRSGNEATNLSIESNPAWAITEIIHSSFLEKLKEFDWQVSIEQWKVLTDLQRFALLKLSRPSHENKNFAKAMKEFGLIQEKS